MLSCQCDKVILRLLYYKAKETFLHILILGSGGREHSITWAVKQNPKCTKLSCAPGNAGIAKIAACIELNINDGQHVKEWCLNNNVDLVIIGPEEPLAYGVSDILKNANITTFAPSKAASKLESSKLFTKEICYSCQAPTAGYSYFDNKEKAIEFIKKSKFPIVVKADGLAAGKGVVIASEYLKAKEAITEMFGGHYGQAGNQVVIEEFMEGEEASLFVLCDGENLISFGGAQDHKRAFDGDNGPNTGGMGAYSPTPVLTKEIEKNAISKIIKPCLSEMRKRGIPYEGVLYAGLMIKDGEPKLVEFNTRFGDPECQVLMMRLGAQALDLILATCEKRLGNAKITWADDHAITIVMAAKGYPIKYDKGSKISGLGNTSENSNQVIFHAGTKNHGKDIVANGGRVLNITTRASTLKEAQLRAYKIIESVDWKEGFYRNDIGWRAL